MEKRRRRPRRFTATAVGSRLADVIADTLEDVWRAAWRLGWDSGVRLLAAAGGSGPVHAAGSAQSLAMLDELTEANSGRARSAARTRLRYLETVLATAQPGTTTAGELAAEITAELASEPLALRLTLTETTWAVNQAALAVYGVAGATTVAWITESDAKVCPACTANDDEGFMPIGVPFQSGARCPPQHPNCRCALIPGRTRGWSPTPANRHDPPRLNPVRSVT